MVRKGLKKGTGTTKSSTFMFEGHEANKKVQKVGSQ